MDRKICSMQVFQFSKIRLSCSWTSTFFVEEVPELLHKKVTEAQFTCSRLRGVLSDDRIICCGNINANEPHD